MIPVTSVMAVDPRKGAALLGLVLVTLAGCWLVPPEQAGSETGVIMNLPDRVGPLWAFPEEVSKTEMAILPPDTTFARKTYGPILSKRFDRILCSIVLSGREKRSIHRPERCLPGQGWSIRDSKVVSVDLASGHPLSVMALLLDRPVGLPNGQSFRLQSYYLYWYVGKEVTTPYSFERVMLTNWDLVRYRLNQRWAYVIVSAYITEGLGANGSGRTPEQTLDLLKEFIRESVPTFMKSEMPPGSIPPDEDAANP
ncbi:MAG TPA: exosortase-associated EpsI family protein [Candidatus Methylacidiphilales bacterium]|nr:exosortase-associated EpsI family protein [Candidatus Methylacidiphilales bacterium]